MKRVKKSAILLAAISVMSMAFFVGCSADEQGQRNEQRIDLSGEEVSYSDYFDVNYSVSNFTWRKKASIAGMANSYIGSAQLTINVYSINSEYRFEDAKLTISTSLLGLGWDSQDIEIALTDSGSAEKTVTVEYDFLSIPDAPDADGCFVRAVEGFVLI